MGVHYFFTMSNRVKIDNPRFLEKSRKILKKNQRKLAKKKRKVITIISVVLNYQNKKNMLQIKEKILCINYLTK